MSLGFIYPIFYESNQLKNVGPMEYFGEGWNYIDVVYILTSVLNTILQFSLGPFHISCKLLMILLIFFIILKTFFFLRIFPQFTPIVTLLTGLITDLRAFQFFFFLQIIMLS